MGNDIQQLLQKDEELAASLIPLRKCGLTVAQAVEKLRFFQFEFGLGIYARKFKKGTAVFGIEQGSVRYGKGFGLDSEAGRLEPNSSLPFPAPIFNADQFPALSDLVSVDPPIVETI